MNRVPVHTASRSYDVLIGHEILREAGTHIRAVLPEAQRCFVVTTPPVKKHWAPIVTESLASAGFEVNFLEMEDGERAKNMTSVEALATKMMAKNADRHSVICALGGGVVGDVAGFLASVFMRGIPVVQMPTTFLAQVDSSVGGKTGVNLKVGKNLVGTFYQPWLVLADPGVFSTLPEREFRSGLYESLKCGVIRRADMFERMERERQSIVQRDPKLLEWLITESVRVKAEVVGADEKESGERRILNFGHTVGHALETETHYKYFLHGEAVAWGMIAATMIAAGLQRTDSSTAERIISSVLAYAPLPKVEVSARKTAHRIKGDKKTVNGVTSFILPREVGKVEIVTDVPERAVIQAIEELKYLSFVE
ncbi:MAG TPA: 3-dehydroquinate synthase [Candidatus Koribacter sp.]